MKELRKKKGIRQKDMANYLNVSTSTVGMYESGKRDPDTETIQKIAQYYGVAVDYLLGNSHIASLSFEEKLKKIGFSDEVAMFFKNFPSWDEEDIEQIIQIKQFLDSKKNKGE